MKSKKKKPKDDEMFKYKDMVLKIANMGANMKPEIIDYENIGKNAVNLCRELLKPKCKKCGKTL